MKSYSLRSRVVLWVLALGLAGTAHAQTVITFSEIGTSEAGLNPADRYIGGSNHNLGVNWIDIDNDGWVDLLATNGKGENAHLYRNNGDGTFSQADELLPSLPDIEMAGSAFADYDNDGDQDIYVFGTYESVRLSGEDHPEGPANLLLKNMFVENGNQILQDEPLFVDVAAASGVSNLADPPLGPDYPGYRSLTGGWLDYDRDGCVDLYVGTMVFSAYSDAVNKNFLYRNNCDGTGTFTDATVTAGADVPVADYRPTLAWIGAHLDSDMDPDMYVVNVQLDHPHHTDYIFKNNSGTFTEVTGLMPGVGDDSGAGMGIDVADIELDGDWDIYITDIFDPGNEPDPVSHGNPLYIATGDGVWGENAAVAAGVSDTDLSWGTNFFDADQDGFEDLYVGDRGRHFLYHNQKNATFDDITTSAGMGAPVVAVRGSATADYDQDGDLDLAIVHRGGHLQLWRNETTGIGNWFKVKLTAVTSNRSAINARVHLTIGGRTLMRQVKGGSSAHSQDDLVVHFGTAGRTVINEVRVLWPSGIVDVMTDVSVNQFLEVVEGSTQLPVELMTFTAVATGEEAVLTWETASETNNSGFEVEHWRDAERFRTIGFVPAAGVEDEGHTYQYRTAPLPPGIHRFRLKQVDTDGAFAYSAEVQVRVGVPGAYRLSAVYPNPFNPRAQFTLAVPAAQQVTVGLYDLLGRQVQTVFAGTLPADEMQTIHVDGGALPSGVYLMRVSGEHFSATQRVTLIK